MHTIPNRTFENIPFWVGTLFADAKCEIETVRSSRSSRLVCAAGDHRRQALIALIARGSIGIVVIILTILQILLDHVHLVGRLLTELDEAHDILDHHPDWCGMRRIDKCVRNGTDSEKCVEYSKEL